MIPNGLFAQERFAFEQGILGLFALSDVTDIALDDSLAACLIDVANEFRLNQPVVFRF